MSTTVEYTADLVQQIADSGNEHHEWLFRGHELARADFNHQFAIGDWLTEGENRWTRKIYAEALDIFTGYTKETLYAFASVARSVGTLIRVKDLSFAHHRTVARFGPETQRELLDYAAKHKLPLRGFQSYVNDKYPAIKSASCQTASPSETEQAFDTEEASATGTGSADWKDHWNGMPEFIQPDVRPFKTIQVHFESQEDVDRFAELVGQKITPQTRYIYFPEKEKACHVDKAYVDAEPEPGDVAGKEAGI